MQGDALENWLPLQKRRTRTRKLPEFEFEDKLTN